LSRDSGILAVLSVTTAIRDIVPPSQTVRLLYSFFAAFLQLEGM
jgi:hypothetical protein